MRPAFVATVHFYTVRRLRNAAMQRRGRKLNTRAQFPTKESADVRGCMITIVSVVMLRMWHLDIIDEAISHGGQ
jgi:hypothetical protein